MICRHWHGYFENMIDTDSQHEFNRGILKAFLTTDIMHNVIFIEDCFTLPSCGANSVVERKGETDLVVDSNTQFFR